MYWEVALALILVVGICITVKEALNKRFVNRNNSGYAEFKQSDVDKVDKESTAERHK